MTRAGCIWMVATDIFAAGGGTCVCFVCVEHWEHVDASPLMPKCEDGNARDRIQVCVAHWHQVYTFVERNNSH